MDTKSTKTAKAISTTPPGANCYRVRDLQNWPDCRNVKALKDRPGYRLRVGRYRVFFDVKDRLQIVEVEEVKKHDEHTY